MNPRYFPKTVDATLGWLVEEAGEVQAAIGKTIRWGLNSVNPELPDEERETNRDWILRELLDLEAAINATRAAITATPATPSPAPEKHWSIPASPMAVAAMNAVTDGPLPASAPSPAGAPGALFLCWSRYDHQTRGANGEWVPLPKICGLPRGHKGDHGPPVGAPAEAETHEAPYYLVERTDRGRAEWLLTGHHPPRWVIDASMADRWTSRELAEEWLDDRRRAHGLPDLIVTEHLDVAAPVSDEVLRAAENAPQPRTRLVSEGARSYEETISAPCPGGAPWLHCTPGTPGDGGQCMNYKHCRCCTDVPPKKALIMT